MVAMFILLLVLTAFSLLSAKQPHIVLIVADDYGWNDIGYHNNKEVKTPNMDKLAADGIKLENYYVQPICTPTRSQLLSGKYQIHTGLQHGIIQIQACRQSGLPLGEVTIADQLQSLGYATHMVGKWHLGFHKKDFLPTYRGFDSHFGFLGGMEDYYNRSSCRLGFCAPDFQENGKSTADFIGRYATNLFTERAENVTNNHNTSQPMFLYLAYNAPHRPMQVPQHYLDQFKDIDDKTRQIYLAMVAVMDEGVGNITAALKRNSMWEDTVMIFTTDNGGTQKHGASNLPLRGGKGSHWEGGIRAVGFLAGQYIRNKGEINHQLLHVSDWYPTIMNLAGGNASNVENLDGFDQWDTIIQNSSNPRREILINIDDLSESKGKTITSIFDTSKRSALRWGDWKILTGQPEGDRGPPVTPRDKRFFLNQEDPENVYLFNIAQDPEEKNELSSQYPEIVDLLLQKLAHYNSTAVPARSPDFDPQCDPMKLGGFWGPWIKDRKK